MNTPETETETRIRPSTWKAISAKLANIIERAAQGEPVYATMAARIDAQAQAHTTGHCVKGCPYCSPHYVGVTIEDFQEIGESL